MGLAITVGYLAELLGDDPEFVGDLEGEFAIANKLLAQAGLPQHVEPRSISLPASRAAIDSFPYSFIHYLRRAYANRVIDAAWVATPMPDDFDTDDDPVLAQAYDRLDSHLLCHSDCEGFYFPIAFDEVIVDTNELGLPGGMLGSSQRLMSELVFVAPALGIQLDGGVLADAEAERVNARLDDENGLIRELCPWIALYEAARISIEQRTAIVFG